MSAEKFWILLLPSHDKREENFQFVSDYSFFPPTHKKASNRLLQQEFFLVACCVESSFIIRECFFSRALKFWSHFFDKKNINARGDEVSCQRIYYETSCRQWCNGRVVEESNKWEKKKRTKFLPTTQEELSYTLLSISSLLLLLLPVVLLISSGLLSTLCIPFITLFRVVGGMKGRWIKLDYYPSTSFSARRLPSHFESENLFYLLSTFQHALKLSDFLPALCRICFNQIMFWLSVCCGICY